MVMHSKDSHKLYSVSLAPPKKCMQRWWAARWMYQMICLRVQEKTGIALKGKLLELMVCSSVTIVIIKVFLNLALASAINYVKL